MLFISLHFLWIYTVSNFQLLMFVLHTKHNTSFAYHIRVWHLSLSSWSVPFICSRTTVWCSSRSACVNWNSNSRLGSEWVSHSFYSIYNDEPWALCSTALYHQQVFDLSVSSQPKINGMKISTSRGNGNRCPQIELKSQYNSIE